MMLPSLSRFLQSSDNLHAAGPHDPLSVDSDLIVFLAALLCGLICVLGLAVVARCAWLRPSRAAAASVFRPTDTGLEKKALLSLPTHSFDSSSAPGGSGKLSVCPICLAEFADGDQVRVLPQCGHGFHVACVDTWFGSHSSCPFCRRILAVPAAAVATSPSRPASAQDAEPSNPQP
ncbi:finger protein [Musa troglodytarum]|uniref:Finger protein n=1 Tax=Musa troglodytarum TaxID=320322 RepID=A0A9E7FRW8_9LILI|nr:finger protein [Musa troglodytarum]